MNVILIAFILLYVLVPLWAEPQLTLEERIQELEQEVEMLKDDLNRHIYGTSAKDE